VSDPEDTGVQGEKANILIVDDQAEKRLVYQTVLEDLGQNIVSARSGEEALRWLLENECAVILLDVNMPGMDGLETAELIRARKKSAHTPIIFITAYADEIHTARGYSLGAVDYILAPVYPNVLRSKVGAFVRLFNLTCQVRRQADERVALAREQAARVVAEASTRRASFLAEASRVISSSLDVNAILKGATRLTVPFLADFSSVTLNEEDGSVRCTEEACTPEWTLQPGWEREALDAVLVQARKRVTAGGRRELFPDARAALASARAQANAADGSGPPRQLGVFPLVVQGRTRGTLALALGPSGREFGSAEIALVEDVAGRTAIAVENCLLYEKIHKADRRKNEFLAMLSHELRNPLAPMRASLHALRLGGTAGSERLMGIMSRQVDHMSRLVDDLLDVARITSGKIVLRNERVDLNRAVREALETCRSFGDAAGRDFSVSFPGEAPAIEADRVRLQQILENLLMNAVKYTDRDGRIGVTVEANGSDAVIRVWDTGIGIAPEMIPHIWDLFAQVDASPERTRKGLGIGLSLVRNLVRLHGGTVEASSAGPGKGSVFTVRLPRVSGGAPAVEAELPAAGAAGPEAPRRVLVVDDNADAAETLGMVLGLMGHRAELAYDGAGALSMAAKFKPDIIFVDIGMPGMSGYELAGRIRADLGMRDARLIALSGFGTEDDRRRSAQSGFDAHIVKPIDPDTLPGVLAAFGARTPQ